MSDFEKGLDELILKNLKRIDEIVLQQKELETERREKLGAVSDLNKTYMLVTGKPHPKVFENRTTAELVEELLREHGELHVDEMIKLLADRQTPGSEIKKPSLVALLVRYTQRGEKFERASRANTFRLIKE